MEVKRLQNQLEREQSQLDTNRAAAGHSTIAVGGDTNSGNTNITNNVLGGGKGGQPSATNHGVGHLPAY
jgi:50S ribosomal subunit-associated GTPase HflX